MDSSTLIIVISLLAALAVLLLGWQIKSSDWTRPKFARRLKKMDEIQSLDAIGSLPAGSLERRLLEAGLTLTPLQLRLGSVALGLVVALVGWFLFIPGLPALMLGGLAAYIPFAMVKDRAESRGLRIDELLPLALSRISAGLQANHSVQAVLQKTGGSLPEGHPLRTELHKTASETIAIGAEQALKGLARRSPSLSLSNLALLLESYARAGGSVQYAEAVTEAATQMQRVVAVRARARSRATQAMQTAKILPLILGVVILMLVNDPSIKDAFQTLVVQVTIGIAMLIMMTGYFYLRSEARRAV